MTDTTKSGDEKLGWRAKLGIGTNDAPRGLPRLADEFKPAVSSSSAAAPQAAARPSPQQETVVAKPKEAAPAAPMSRPPAPGSAPMAAPRSIAKPAPMAPRVAARPLGADAGDAPLQRPVASSGLTPARPMTAPLKAHNDSAPDALANRLKAQREAAEKLAEQRIQVARQRAEAAQKAKVSAEQPMPPPMPQMAPPQSYSPPPLYGNNNGAGSRSEGPRPKFAFAEDESKPGIRPALSDTFQPGLGSSPRPTPPMQRPITPPQLTVPQSPSLAPPRQPLGVGQPMSRAPAMPQYPQGDMPETAPPPSYAGYSAAPGYAAQQPFSTGYRQVDPITGYAGPGPSHRGNEPMEEGGGYAPPPPIRTRRPLPGNNPPQSDPYGESDDIFEQPLRSNRRPTPNEYRQAYQERDEFVDEPRRSSAPWLWLLGLVALIGAAGAGYWAWDKLGTANIASRPAGTTVETPATPADNTPPVVDPPADTAIVTPPDQGQTQGEVQTQGQSGVQQGGTASQSDVNQINAPASPSRKEIYDRIVGDREVLGDATLMPTEVAPDEPGAGQVMETQQPVADPPQTQDQGAGDAAPLPVPPPVENNGTQGNLQPAPATGAGTRSADVETVDAIPQNDNAVTTASEPEIRPTGTIEDLVEQIGNEAAPAATQSAAADPSAGQLDAILPMPKDKVTTLEQPPAQPKPVSAVVTDTETLALPSSKSSSQAAVPQVSPATASDGGSDAATSAAARAFIEASQSADAAPTPVAPVNVESDPATVADAESVPAKPALSQPAQTEQAETTEPVEPAIKPEPKKQIAAAEKPKTRKAPAEQRRQRETSNAAGRKLGDEPVVLVAPKGQSRSTANAKLNASDGVYGNIAANEPNLATAASQQTEQPQQRKRTLRDLLAGNGSSTAQPREPEQQVSSIQRRQAAPQQAPVRDVQQPSGGGGFVAQLATFRSQAEATAEFQKLRAKYPQVVGSLSPVISQTSVGGSRRYRLGVGPMQTDDAAGSVCARLIQAGEPDCVVRRN
jgi:hypothetical protein